MKIFLTIIVLFLIGLSGFIGYSISSSDVKKQKQEGQAVSELSTKKTEQECEECKVAKAIIEASKKNASGKELTVDDVKSELDDKSTNNIPVEVIAGSLKPKSYEALKEKFSNEQVTPEWAYKLEEVAHRTFQDANNIETLNQLGVIFTDIECRTSMCELEFDSSGKIESAGKASRVMNITKVFITNPEFQGFNGKVQFTDNQKIKYLISQN